MAKTLCKILGVIFLLVGIAGFAAPTLMGFHLTPAHNLVHLLSGAIALYLGFSGSLSAAKTFCLVFGVVYLGLGILGMVLGDPANEPNVACRSVRPGNDGPRTAYIAGRCFSCRRALYKEPLKQRYSLSRF